MFNIEFLYKKENYIIIRGWAFSEKSEKPVKIQIHGKNNKTIVKTMNLSRIDVKTCFEKYEFNIYCGFEYLIEVNFNDITRIDFVDENNSVESINKDELAKCEGVSNFVRYKKLFRSLLRTGYNISFRNKFKINQDKLSLYGYEIKNSFYNGYNKVENIYKTKKDLVSYLDWVNQNTLSMEDLDFQKKVHFNKNPLISIVTPTYNTKNEYLDELVNSLFDQTYSNWELCIADGSNIDSTKERLRYWMAKDSRIKVNFLKENVGIVGNSNSACELAEGEFIGLIDHDDILSKNALYEIVKIINQNQNVEYIYSDEDKLTEDGTTRFYPVLKPDWSPDTMRSSNYLCHFSVIKKALLDKVGYFKEGFEGSQDYELFLRITDSTDNIVHIPKILYHWRAIIGSTALNAEAKLYAYESGKKALQEHLARLDLKGHVEICEKSYTYKVFYELIEKPLVSILINIKGDTKSLKKCISSILNKTSYENYEIIIIDSKKDSNAFSNYYSEIKNFKNIKVLVSDLEFSNTSSLYNFGVKNSNGKYLVFLDSNIEIITTDWIESFLSYNQRNDVSIVGCKILFKDDTIKHGGIIIGINDSIGCAHRFFSRDSAGYFNRLIIPHNLSAVSAACMMTKREVFDEVNGFDEKFIYKFNDIDYCLKTRDKGYYIIFDPYIEVYSNEMKESESRKIDLTFSKQFETDKDFFKNKWKQYFEKGDPFYNQNLSLETEDFRCK